MAWRARDRRKDGQIYAEQLTINVIANKDGSVHRYVAIFSDITEKKHAADLVWRQANYDSVTSLPNRRLFLDRLDQEMKKSRRSTHTLALFFIDLDRFKEVNDTHGHGVGDLLLVEVAMRINACIRSTDTASRLGGDEFTVILTDLVDTTRVETIAKNIVDTLKAPFHIGELELNVSGSVGIATYPANASSAEELIHRADIAMYASKRQGRDQYSLYTNTMGD